MFFKVLLAAAAIGGAAAQRPADMPICDYYTTALLKENTAANQLTLLTLVVNTAVVGNYTTPNVGIAVPGILAKGTYNGTEVDLLPYFSGALNSTNNGGNNGVVMNFLDDGGAEPLKKNMPANGKTSNQYILLTHLYEYFGTLLGCSLQGKSNDYLAYDGDNSMYKVHRFMALDAAQIGYFITQVGLSAASFGVTAEDAAAVGMALGKLFAYRCVPEQVVIPSQPSDLQAICVADDCPLSPDATCDAYDALIEPVTQMASMTTTGPASAGETSMPASVSMEATKTAATTASGSAAPATNTAKTGDATAVEAGLGAMVAIGGVLAILL